MLNQSGSNSVSIRPYVQSSNIINSTNFKFICEVCGYQALNIDSLRLHLNNHNTKQSPENSQEIFSTKPKLNSIVTTAKVTPSGLSSSTSAIINMPQSMTVFNLKDISSKLKNFKTISNKALTGSSISKPNILKASTGPTTAKSISSSPTATASVIFSVLKEENKEAGKQSIDLNNNHNPVTENSIKFLEQKKQHETNSTGVKSSDNLQEKDNKYENGSDFKSLSFSSIEKSIMTTTQKSEAFQTLPYHYSEYESLYICNLCHCTYDSLRSIKAHLWKHSGHHDLSYPIHDYNNRENLINANIVKPSLNVKKSSPQIPSINTEQIFQLEPCNENTKTPPHLEDSNEHDNKKESEESSSSNLSSPSSSNQRIGGGGICSALLEVIEKLRDEEESQQPDTQKTLNTDKKMKKNTKNGQSRLQSLNHKKMKSQFKKKIMSNEVIEDKIIDEINDVELNNEECKIETSVVNNLLDEDDDVTLIQRSEASLKSETINSQPASNSARKNIKNTSYTRLKNSLNIHNKHRKQFNHKKPLTSKLKGTPNKFKYEEISKKNDNNFTDTGSILIPSTIAVAQNNAHHNLLGSASSSNKLSSLTKNDLDLKKNDLINLLDSLAHNDGFEQYVCGLCSYVCYHLPSLKSHMWTHVKNIKFDYSVNTSIINAALDYENKLIRKLNSIKKCKLFDLNMNKANNENSMDENPESDSEVQKTRIFLERQFLSALDLVNYPQAAHKLSSICNNMPMVSFRCTKCGFETTNLSLLRLHKREHYMIDDSRKNELEIQPDKNEDTCLKID